MLTRSLFGWNSNRTGRISDKSYWVRSASATKASAASSLRSSGSFRFIVIDLPSVHVPGADRADQPPAAPRSDCEDDEHVSTRPRASDRLEPLLGHRVVGVGMDGDFLAEQVFDLGD